MDSAETNFKPEIGHLPIRLYFQDEARFGRMNSIQKCWVKKGVQAKVPQQLIREYTYAYSSVCPETGEMFSLILPQVNIASMDIFLQEFSDYKKDERIILCMDKAGWHTTTQITIPDNITLWHLPPYSPELNPVELIWRELRSKYFNNRMFETLDDVDEHLELALIDFSKDKSSIKSLCKLDYL